MSNKLICPFCGKELVPTSIGDNDTVLYASVWLPIKNCICNTVASKKIWQALIQSRQELDDYKHNYSVKSEQHERGYAYATKTIKELERKFEIVLNTLKKADKWFGDNQCLDPAKWIRRTVKQIEHKE